MSLLKDLSLLIVFRIEPLERDPVSIEVGAAGRPGVYSSLSRHAEVHRVVIARPHERSIGLTALPKITPFRQDSCRPNRASFWKSRIRTICSIAGCLIVTAKVEGPRSGDSVQSSSRKARSA